jgi:hypothetical protein
VNGALIYLDFISTKYKLLDFDGTNPRVLGATCPQHQCFPAMAVDGVAGKIYYSRYHTPPGQAMPAGEGEPRTGDTTGQGGDGEVGASTPEADRRRARGLLWADLMRRTFGFDVLACPSCGGRLRLIALIDHAPVIEKILRHLGLPSEIPKPTLARAPPREHVNSAVLDPGC